MPSDFRIGQNFVAIADTCHNHDTLFCIYKESTCPTCKHTHREFATSLWGEEIDSWREPQGNYQLLIEHLERVLETKNQTGAERGENRIPF